jgi:hypothetical protein
MCDAVDIVDGSRDVGRLLLSVWEENILKPHDFKAAGRINILRKLLMQSLSLPATEVLGHHAMSFWNTINDTKSRLFELSDFFERARQPAAARVPRCC